jgi:Tfp pilus assembly protein PilX
MKKKSIIQFRKRPGMVLIVALLIMAIMSIIGASAMTTSRIDIRITSNLSQDRQAFYATDGGIEQPPKYIRAAIDGGSMQAVSGITFSADLYDEIMGYQDDAGDQIYPTVVNPDVSVPMARNTIIMDVDRLKQKQLAGSGVEFGSGAEGAGTGTQGGIVIFYGIDAYGTTQANSDARVDVYYRYVLGVAGGK